MLAGVGVALEVFEKGHAGHRRHHEVEEDHVRADGPGPGHGLDRAVAQSRLEPGLPQEGPGGEVEHGRLVVDDEDLHQWVMMRRRTRAMSSGEENGFRM